MSGRRWKHDRDPVTRRLSELQAQALYSAGSIAPASWKTPAWFLDGVNGNDNASGTSAQFPVKTITGGLIPKWGTRTPILPQNTSLSILNGQALGLEAAVLAPITTGGSNFSVVGTPANVGATFHPSVVTAKNRATPTVLKLSGMPAAAAAGMLVRNVTKSSSAIIDSVAAGVATMSQPLADAGLTTVTAVPTYTEDDTWAAGDTYQLQALPNLNLSIFQAAGGGSDVAGDAPTGWLQMLHVPDPSGTPGFSTFSPTAADGNQLVMSCVTTDCFLRIEGGRAPFNLFAANCWAPNGAQVVAANLIGGAYNTNLSANQTLIDNISSVDGDVIVHGTLVVKGNPYVICGLCYCDGAVSLAHTATLLIEPDVFASANLWGPASMNLEGPLSAVQNATGGLWANCLTLKGAITIEGVGTGTKVVDGAPSVWTAGIAVTAANLDANNGLQNPRTGSRFCTN